MPDGILLRVGLGLLADYLLKRLAATGEISLGRSYAAVLAA